jgi:hypothetical protein
VVTTAADEAAVDLSTINFVKGNRVVMTVRCASKEDVGRLTAVVNTSHLRNCSLPIRARGIVCHHLAFHQELYRFCR